MVQFNAEPLREREREKMRIKVECVLYLIRTTFNVTRTISHCYQSRPREAGSD